MLSFFKSLQNFFAGTMKLKFQSSAEIWKEIGDFFAPKFGDGSNTFRNSPILPKKELKHNRRLGLFKNLSVISEQISTTRWRLLFAKEKCKTYTFMKIFNVVTNPSWNWGRGKSKTKTRVIMQLGRQLGIAFWRNPRCHLKT